MKTMADVIIMHSQIGRDEQGQFCKGCNHRYGYAAERQLHYRASAHVAESLDAEGYGSVRHAQGYALRSAAAELATLSYVYPGGVGREEYERMLAIRRGNTDEWLKARAKEVEAQP